MEYKKMFIGLLLSACIGTAEAYLLGLPQEAGFVKDNDLIKPENISSIRLVQSDSNDGVTIWSKGENANKIQPNKNHSFIVDVGQNPTLNCDNNSRGWIEVDYGDGQRFTSQQFPCGSEQANAFLVKKY